MTQQSIGPLRGAVPRLPLILAVSVIAGRSAGAQVPAATNPTSASAPSNQVTPPTPAVPSPMPINVPPPTRPPAYLPFPQLPPLVLDETNNRVGIAQETARTRKLQARILWIDATANLNRINTAEKIAALVEKIKKTGFNTIVLDVKPIVGFTLHPSKFAPKLTEWLDGRTLPAAFDPVLEFVTRAHAAGLQLVASMAAFSEGHQLVHQGPGYEHPQWQTVLYEPQVQVRSQTASAALFPLSDRANAPARSSNELAVYTELGGLKPQPESIVAIVTSEGRVQALADGSVASLLSHTLPAGTGALVGTGPGAFFLSQHARVGDLLNFETIPTYVPISQRPEQQVPLMTNPNSAAVRQHLLDMVAELVRGYALDGVIFDDRLRYANINADFSPETRQQFETYLGQSVRWPDDVFRYEVEFPSLNRHVVPGPFYDSWLIWRAQTLRNWLASAVATVKAIRPGATVSVYSGSWYGEYPVYGANWAADDFQAGFRFLTPSYQKTGFAGLLDWMTTGCYYPAASISEAIAAGKIGGASVEAAGQLTNRVVNDQTWCYAGIQLGDYSRRPEALQRALQAACASTQGVMVFDLSHFDYRGNEGLWSVFEEAFREPAQAPHAIGDLLAKLRQTHAERKAAGVVEPPVVIYGGIPGTGL